MLTFDLDEAPEECKWCKTMTVVVTDDGMKCCKKCARDHGCTLVNQWREFSGLKAATGRYCKKAYRQSIYNKLMNASKEDIPPKICELVESHIKNTHPDDLRWQDLKKLLPTKYPLKAKCVYALPRLLGFEYELHDTWYSMIERAVKADPNPEKTKLNNLYVLYQCVKICGYFTSWIPIHLTKAKQNQFNKRWIVICDKLGWEYHHMCLLPHIDIDQKKDEKDVGSCAYVPNGLDINVYEEDKVLQEFGVGHEINTTVECELTDEQRRAIQEATR
jgi:hypothetical protein